MVAVAADHGRGSVLEVSEGRRGLSNDARLPVAGPAPLAYDRDRSVSAAVRGHRRRQSCHSTLLLGAARWSTCFRDSSGRVGGNETGRWPCRLRASATGL